LIDVAANAAIIDFIIAPVTIRENLSNWKEREKPEDLSTGREKLKY